MNDETKAAELIEAMQADLSVGDEITLDHAAAVDNLCDWVRGEPARLAAAREEQREACAREAKEYCCGQEPERVVRATPLTSTPLGDENAALKAEKETEWQAHLAEKAAFVSEVAALKVRVAELEAYASLADADAASEEKRGDELEARAEKAEADRDEARRQSLAWERSSAKCADERDVALRERDALKAKLEAVRAFFMYGSSADALNVLAVLDAP